MVGLAFQIVSFVIVATAVFYGGMFLLGILGWLGIAAGGAVKGSAKQESKPELIPDNVLINEINFKSLLSDYSDKIMSLQDPKAAESCAIFFEDKFMIGKRLMRMMLNLEEFYSPMIIKQVWRNKIIPLNSLKKSKDTLTLAYKNLSIVLLPESKEYHDDFGSNNSPYYVPDVMYERAVRVLQGKNVVFEEELNYRDRHGSYYFLTDMNKRFNRVTYSQFIFKPSQWLFDLFNLCIGDVREFQRIQKEDVEMKLIASQQKVKENFYPA